MNFKIKDIFSNRGIATIYLVAMCTQFVAWEGYGVSDLKVALMAFAPVLLLFKVPYMTKATVWCSVYMAVVLFCAYMQDYVRFSTIGYLGMFLITYIVYYNLLYEKQAFSLLYFIRLLRFLILAFFICLVLQQVCILLGITYMPIINFDNQVYLAIDKLPSLMIEPSHTARVLGCLYLAYLQCCEIVEREKLSLKRIFEKPHRWITIGFLYTMTTMGSGTAFIVLMILAMYFIKVKTLWYVVPIFVVLYFTLPLMNIHQLDRAINTINATMTGDVDVVVKADGSAAARVAPILNTIKDIDLYSSKTWFGEGTYTKEVASDVQLRFSRKVGRIDEFGLLSFIFMQVVFFVCVVPKFLSIETMFWFMVFAATFGNVAYGWGAMMLFTAVSFFLKNK